MLNRIKARHEKYQLVAEENGAVNSQAHQDRGKLLELVEDIKTTIYFNMSKIEDSKMYDEFEALLKKLN